MVQNRHIGEPGAVADMGNLCALPQLGGAEKRANPG